MTEPVARRPGSNRLRLSITLAAVSAVAFALASALAIRIFDDDLRGHFRAVLETSLQSRVQELGSYARSVENDLKIVGSLSLVQAAVGDFSRAFHDLGPDPMTELQRVYIEENPHGVTFRHKLLKADDGSEYSDLHSVYHAWLSGLVSARDYYDLFLVDPDGNIVYTVFKEDDLGTNLLTGTLNGAPIADAYQEAVESTPGSVVGTGFARYAPSKNIPAAFIGTPLHHDGRFAGALILQLRLDPFNSIMQGAHSLGDSFESYLVNGDRLMVSQSRVLDETVLTREVATPSVEGALAGATGFGIVVDYRGVPVLSAYQPFDWIGVKWAVVAELDVEELNRSGESLRLSLLIAGLSVVVVSALFGWLVAARD